MAAMTKRVNINAPVAIRNITPPIYGVCKNVIMSTGDILKCLCKRAIVDEILPNGSTVRLNMRNYYTDNGAGLDPSAIDTETRIDAVEESVDKSSSTTQDEKPISTIVDTDPTNVPGTVNEIEDTDSKENALKDEESVTTPEEDRLDESETVFDDKILAETEETSVNNEESEKNETSIEADEEKKDEEIIKDEKPVEKKSQTKASSTSSKKKSTNNSSKKKTTSK